MRAPVENRYLHGIYGGPKPHDKAHADLDNDIRSVFSTPSPNAPNSTNQGGPDRNTGPEDRSVGHKSV
jgi:hypothetical protein